MLAAASLLLASAAAAPCPTGLKAEDQALRSRLTQAPPAYAGSVQRVAGAAPPPARLVRRLDDSALGLSAWQACDDVSQCVAVDNGCLLSAVHRDFLPPARERAWARGGDPRAMSCEPRVRDDLVLACVDRRCGAWRVAPATR